MMRLTGNRDVEIGKNRYEIYKVRYSYIWLYKYDAGCRNGYRSVSIAINELITVVRVINNIIKYYKCDD